MIGENTSMKKAKYNKKQTKKIIDTWFNDNHYMKPIPGRKPFNGIVKRNENIVTVFNYDISCDKIYYIINGFIVEDDKSVLGTDFIVPGVLYNYGWFPECPATPFTKEDFNVFENGMLEIVEDFDER